VTAFLWEQASWWLRRLLRSAWRRHARWLEGGSMEAALTDINPSCLPDDRGNIASIGMASALCGFVAAIAILRPPVLLRNRNRPCQLFGFTHSDGAIPPAAVWPI